jgi:hypothetical protein
VWYPFQIKSVIVYHNNTDGILLQAKSEHSGFHQAFLRNRLSSFSRLVPALAPKKVQKPFQHSGVDNRKERA